MTCQTTINIKNKESGAKLAALLNMSVTGLIADSNSDEPKLTKRENDTLFCYAIELLEELGQ